jgi:hypothetical protein
MFDPFSYPEEVVAYIDRKATEAKQSRSAWMTGALRRMHMMDSPAGKKGLAHLLLGVMADGALHSGQPIEHVRKLFPDFERPLALDQTPGAPMLPAAAPSSESVTATRRRPYQRGAKRLTHGQP